MLTNLYRVFYVMWNTWSRCSLLSLSLSFSLFSLLSPLFVFVFFPFFCWNQNISEGLTDLAGGFFSWTRKASCVHTWDAGSRQKMQSRGQIVMAEKNIAVHSCWLKHRKGMEAEYFRPLLDKCFENTIQDFLKYLIMHVSCCTSLVSHRILWGKKTIMCFIQELIGDESG